MVQTSLKPGSPFNYPSGHKRPWPTKLSSASYQDALAGGSSLARRQYSDSRVPKMNVPAMSEDIVPGFAQPEELLRPLLPRSPPRSPPNLLQILDIHRNDIGEEYAVCYIDRNTRELRCETNLVFDDRDALMECFGQILVKGSIRRGNTSPASTSSVEEEEEEVENIDDCGATEGLRIKIGERDKIWKVYDERLKAIGQICLKKVLKAWIREIHPQKQAKYPYNGGKKKGEAISKFGEDNKGDLTKPEWWPPELRHREPDHQMKPERLALAHHLLQHFNAEGFRRSTVDIVLSLDERYKESVPALLNEIYAVRAAEERHSRNELDDDAVVIVSKRYLEVQRARPRPKVSNTETGSDRRRKKSGSKTPEGTKKRDDKMKQVVLPLTPESPFTPPDPSHPFGANDHDMEIEGHLPDSSRKRQKCEPGSTNLFPLTHPLSCFMALDPNMDLDGHVSGRSRHDKTIPFQTSVDVGISSGDHALESFSADFSKQAFFTAADSEPRLVDPSRYPYGQTGFIANSTEPPSSSSLNALSFTRSLVGSQPDTQATCVPYICDSAICPHGFSRDWSVKCVDCEILTGVYHTTNADFQYQSRFLYPNDAALAMEPHQLQQVITSRISTGLETLPCLPAFTPFAPQKVYHPS